MTSKLRKYVPWIAGGLALVGALLMLRAPGQVRGPRRRRVRPPPGAGGRPAEAARLDGAQRAAPHPGPAELPLPGPDRGLGRVDPRRPLPAAGGRPAAHLRHRQPRRAGDHEDGADQGPLLLLPADRPLRERDPARGQRRAGHRRQAADPLPVRRSRTCSSGSTCTTGSRTPSSSSRSPGLAAEIAGATSPGAAQRQAALADLAYFRPIPPLPGQKAEAWSNTGEALRGVAMGAVNPGLEPMVPDRLGLLGPGRRRPSTRR